MSASLYDDPVATGPGTGPGDAESCGLDLLGLDDIGSTLTAPPQAVVEATGRPIVIPHENIDPDPGQVRGDDNPGFTEESIAELAATIAASHQTTPCSVFPNPNEPGRYILNHGERRWRAIRLLGDRPVRCFVDEPQTDDEKMAEVIQREGLTVREIGDYIGRKQSQGLSDVKISKLLGKSRAWLSNHTRILRMTGPVADAFAAGRIVSIDTVNMLDRAFATHPDLVQALLAGDDAGLTRSAVLKELDAAGARPRKAEQHRPGSKSAKQAAGKKAKRAAPYRGTALYEHGGAAVVLDLSRRPEAPDTVWVRGANDGVRRSVPIAEVVLTRVVEGAASH